MKRRNWREEVGAGPTWVKRMPPTLLGLVRFGSLPVCNLRQGSGLRLRSKARSEATQFRRPRAPVHPDVVGGRAVVPRRQDSRRSGSSALPRDLPATCGCRARAQSTPRPDGPQTKEGVWLYGPFGLPRWLRLVVNSFRLGFDFWHSDRKTVIDESVLAMEMRPDPGVGRDSGEPSKALAAE